jgi:hypothetical protein
MTVVNPEGYPTPSLKEKKVEAGGDRYQTPDSVLAGWPEELDEITDKIYADFNKEQGTDFKFPLKK